MALVPLYPIAVFADFAAYDIVVVHIPHVVAPVNQRGSRLLRPARCEHVGDVFPGALSDVQQLGGFHFWLVGVDGGRVHQDAPEAHAMQVIAQGTAAAGRGGGQRVSSQ